MWTSVLRYLVPVQFSRRVRTHWVLTIASVSLVGGM